MSSEEWCTIESDPGVFSELIEDFGVKGLQVDEVFSLDQPIPESLGLIFLFKWRRETDDRPVADPETLPELFFAKQVITNACATQAILSVLLNVPAEGAGDVDLGGDLRAFREFSLAFDAESKGLAIGNSDRIRLSHNSFARRDAFMIEQTQQDKKKGEAHHFVAYVPHQGAVFELDGLKAGPILLGPIPGGEGAQQGDWLEVARPAVAARMARYSASETHFALMSIRKSLASALTKEISVLEARVRVMEAVSQSGEGFGQSVIEEGGETFQLAADFDGLEVQQADARARLQALRSDAAEEERRIQRQREENVRRRHNYVPLASALLGALAARRHEGSGGSWLDEMRRQAESRASTRRTLLNSKSK